MSDSSQVAGSSAQNSMDSALRASSDTAEAAEEIDLSGWPQEEPDAPSPRQQQAREIGEQFRASREASGMALEEVAAHLHLPWRLLRQLESGQWDQISTPIYLRGYLRSYCNLLGIPEPELIAEVEQEVATPQQLISTGGISRGHYLAKRYATAATYLVITALIVVPVVILGLNGGLSGNLARLAPLDPPELAQPGSSGDESATETKQGSNSDAPQSSSLMASMTPIGLIDSYQKDDQTRDTSSSLAAAQPALQTEAGELAAATDADSDNRLTILLNAPSWVEVTAADGERLEYALLDAGKHRYEHTGDLTVRLGNAGAATVTRSGHKLKLQAYRHANVAFFGVDASGNLQNPASSP